MVLVLALAVLIGIAKSAPIPYPPQNYAQQNQIPNPSYQNTGSFCNSSIGYFGGPVPPVSNFASSMGNGGPVGIVSPQYNNFGTPVPSAYNNGNSMTSGNGSPAGIVTPQSNNFGSIVPPISNTGSSTTNSGSSQARAEDSGCNRDANGKCIKCSNGNEKALLVDVDKKVYACGVEVNGCKVYDAGDKLSCKECTDKNNGPFLTTENKKICVAPIADCEKYKPDGNTCDVCKENGSKRLPSSDGKKCLTLEKDDQSDPECKYRKEKDNAIECLPTGWLDREKDGATGWKATKCDEG
ncbi:hypothetical protein ROZALSC1DRAFT_29858 [Rozella allomycis CSF55]|uniref:Uncharacterized protein n=1 Tax=Rozella allomycis (strain CSF55) TaxID=988480 RepID=A0A4P9YGQ0_ROZAC|nr:hypothetical protein ROZALSC1DRAFT_29858 [Rozella allomycis CSF55]